MKTNNLKQYFTDKKEDFTPNVKDFELVLSKLGAEKKVGRVPSPSIFTVFLQHRFATLVTTSAFALLLVFIGTGDTSAPGNIATTNGNGEEKLAFATTPTKKTETINEALSVIDSVSSFDTSNQ